MTDAAPDAKDPNPPLPDSGPRDGDHEHSAESWPSDDVIEVDGDRVTHD